MRRTEELPAGERQLAAAPPQVFRKIFQAVDLVATGMAYVSGGLFLLASFYITADVLGRKFFHISSAVTDEIGGYALAMGGMWALAYALGTEGHVRIDVLLPHLPLRLRLILDYAALVLMALFALMVAIYAWRLALDSYAVDARAMSFIRTPLFLPQSLMALGFTVLTLEALVMLAVGLAESLRLGRLASLAVLRSSELGEEA